MLILKVETETPLSAPNANFGLVSRLHITQYPV